ncbi:hypothetical protein B9G54_03615 [Alloscardovia macacae]|uniref:Uncharacterized protein n=1 Tax=Alloscardovia macacae TaxID=1160091 RepID=A0A1Y2T0W9_9BIFI|nr:hypothetical protein [Alloscardovia macacae]OTA26677.1 hypothetical protein B9G54_03615 [Alloscardovia macacae]OTA29544.1 hypothetical protein B9T39_02765 [Alloscardovia macacae]
MTESLMLPQGEAMPQAALELESENAHDSRSETEPKPDHAANTTLSAHTYRQLGELSRLSESQHILTAREDARLRDATSIVEFDESSTTPASFAQNQVTSDDVLNILEPPVQRSPLVRACDFPGPMCLTHLALAHILTPLGEGTYYLSRFNDTIELRARVVREIIPFGSIASGMLAAWIWLGGAFPDHIDIARDNHYRSILFGRDVRVTTRQIHSSFLVDFSHFLTTTPLRTVCDLACSEDTRASPARISAVISQLIMEFRITEHECLELLRSNTRQPRYTRGMNLILRVFAAIQRETLAQATRAESTASQSALDEATAEAKEFSHDSLTLA